MTLFARLLVLAVLLLPASLPLQAAQVQAPAQAAARGPISFSYTPAQLGRAYAAAETELLGALDAVAALPAVERTFENTVLAYEQAWAVYGDRMKPLTFLKQVSPDPAVRKAAEKVDAKADKLGVAVTSREDLYRALKEYEAKGEELGPREAALLADSLRAFRHGGLGLAPAQRRKLKRMKNRLKKLAQAFEKNIREHKDGLELTREQLDGLPQDYIDGLERTEDGKYVVTLAYPDYRPFMQYAKDADLRRELSLKYNNKGGEKNVSLLEEALALRLKTAELLGYRSYPHLILEERMSKGPERVMDFLNRLWPILRGQGDRELAEVLEVKRREAPQAERVESWDLGYYGRLLRQERFDLDPEEVKPYFPVERVIAGTLSVYERMLGLTFSEVEDAEVWHPDVKLYEISDAATGRRLSHFYLDLHPREGKYSHAAAFDLKVGRELGPEGYNEPAAAMVANFTKPLPDKPALLEFGEVETFFHEFGHLMHATLTRAKYSSQAGFNVAWDFVEAPSQILENFIWEREVLDEISGHYEDPSKKLPEELHKRMLAARDFGQGLHYLRQLSFAVADMMIHLSAPVRINDLFNQFLELIGLFPIQPGSRFVGGFGHLMGGYGAGYYSYLWSEVFADDIWSRFRKEGVMNPEVGLSYRREILERGSERPEDESLRAFLGREPSVEAFLERLKGESQPAGPGA